MIKRWFKKWIGMDDLPIFVVEYVAKDKMKSKRFTYTHTTEDLVSRLQAFENEYTGQVLQLNLDLMESIETSPYTVNLN